MSIINKTIGTWLKTKGTILKIVSNPKRGTIKIYNKKGKILIKKTNLTKDQLRIVEESLLGFASKKLNDVNNKQKDNYDPMIT